MPPAPRLSVGSRRAVQVRQLRRGAAEGERPQPGDQVRQRHRQVGLQRCVHEGRGRRQREGDRAHGRHAQPRHRDGGRAQLRSERQLQRLHHAGRPRRHSAPNVLRRPDQPLRALRYLRLPRRDVPGDLLQDHDYTADARIARHRVRLQPDALLQGHGRHQPGSVGRRPLRAGPDVRQGRPAGLPPGPRKRGHQHEAGDSPAVLSPDGQRAQGARRHVPFDVGRIGRQGRREGRERAPPPSSHSEAQRFREADVSEGQGEFGSDGRAGGRRSRGRRRRRGLPIDDKRGSMVRYEGNGRAMVRCVDGW
mmetsp:Transcript_9436/g.17745  ORF Transcript_9436/g.17745 Transcript_9436/m.17745 type:complete len:307 (+) Transcript_9436:507-1427(+)